MEYTFVSRSNKRKFWLLIETLFSLKQFDYSRSGTRFILEASEIRVREGQGFGKFSELYRYGEGHRGILDFSWTSFLHLSILDIFLSKMFVRDYILQATNMLTIRPFALLLHRLINPSHPNVKLYVTHYTFVAVTSSNSN